MLMPSAANVASNSSSSCSNARESRRAPRTVNRRAVKEFAGVLTRKIWVDGVVREVVSYDIKGTSMRLFTSSIKNSNVGLQTACGAAQPTDLQRPQRVRTTILEFWNSNAADHERAG
jgi:hypothetical protein